MIVASYRVTKFAMQNFWRNFWLSLITVSMLVMTLFTVNILLLLNVLAEHTVTQVEDRIEVSVYFHESTTQETVTGAVEYLRGIAQVRDVEVVSAQEAYEEFAGVHAGDEEIMASLDEIGTNPFGPTLVILAHEAEDFDMIIDALDNPQFAADIREKDFSDYQSIVESIRSTTDRVATVGIALTIIFLLIAILIVFNTVRIGIFIHREEIGIMRLVGASNWFIKAPFHLEMIFLSLLAVGITAGIAYPALGVIDPQFSAYFGTAEVGLKEYFQTNGLWIFGGQFLTLVVITVVSTSLAMRKYLRV